MVTAEGLRPVKEVGMYGKIAVMELFRPKVRCGAGWEGKREDLEKVVGSRCAVVCRSSSAHCQTLRAVTVCAG